MAAFAGQFDQETGFSIITHNFPCLTLYSSLSRLASSCLWSSREGPSFELMSVNDHSLSYSRMCGSGRLSWKVPRSGKNGASSIAGRGAQKVSGPKTVIINADQLQYSGHWPTRSFYLIFRRRFVACWCSKSDPCPNPSLTALTR
jgi:hypothetical protein